MLVVSLALVAVLVARNGGEDATATGQPSSAENTGSRQVLLPVALLERLDHLPPKLREETLNAYAGGALRQDQVERIVTDYENRNPSVRVGSVLDTGDDRLRIEVFTTGEQLEIATGADTLVRRSDQRIPLADLRPGELVMVVTTGGGAIALTIEAFGVTAP